MKEIIPFKKDVLFKTKISEITDISLEHDYKITDDMVEGFFILEGTYKITEGSVINEDFFYKIPFSIAMTDNYKKESINLGIKDFSYEIKNNDTLTIHVELNLEADLEEQIEDVIDEVLSDREEIDTEEYIEENTEELPKEIEEKEDKETLEDKEALEDKDLENIVKEIKNEDNYITYKVYIAKEGDTIDNISYKYNISSKTFLKYNSETVNIGDKIIIPEINE